MNLIQSLDEIYNSKNEMKNAFINIGVNATGDLSLYARYIENLSPSSSFNGMLQFNNEEEMLNYNTPIVDWFRLNIDQQQVYKADSAISTSACNMFEVCNFANDTRIQLNMQRITLDANGNNVSVGVRCILTGQNGSTTETVGLWNSIWATLQRKRTH